VGIPWGTFAILGACLCWAIDNNFTRQVSASDSVQIAGLKGLVAGLVNLSLGLALGFHLPVWSKIMSADLVGLWRMKFSPLGAFPELIRATTLRIPPINDIEKVVWSAV